jgi:hypothetical protein
MLKQFRLQTLQPELDDIADDLNIQVIEPFWGEEYGCEFEPAAVGDDEMQEKQLSLDLQAGIRTFNEWRVLRKLPKVEGQQGEQYVKGGGKTDAQPGQQGQEQNGIPGGQEPKPQGAPARPQNEAGRGSLPGRINAILNGNGKH